MIDAWVAPILNRLKGIERKSDSLKEEVAKDSTVAKESTNQEIKTTAQEILDKVSSGGDMSTLENMISGYTTVSATKYIPMRTPQHFFIGESIDATEYQLLELPKTYTWTAVYSGSIYVAVDGYAEKSSYAPYIRIYKNGEQVSYGYVKERKLVYYSVSVENGDSIQIRLESSYGGWDGSFRTLFIAYDIEPDTRALNIIKSIQQGSVNLKNSFDTNPYSVVISPVNRLKSVPFITGGTIISFNGYELNLAKYVHTDYALQTSAYWTIIEFY